MRTYIYLLKISLLSLMLEFFSSNSFAQDYLCFTAVESGSSVQLVKVGNLSNFAGFEVSTDGTAWTTYDYSVQNLTSAGDKVYFRTAQYGNGVNQGLYQSEKNYCRFVMNGLVDGSGLLDALLHYPNGYPTFVGHDFYKLFSGCSALRTAPTLPYKESQYTYGYTFENCTNLLHAPTGVKTDENYSAYCYQGMFKGCTKLQDCLDYKTGYRAEGCFQSMYEGCTSLVEAAEFYSPDCDQLSINTVAAHCYERMFYGCTSLTNAPAICATNLADYCYASMFEGCTSLEGAPSLPATTLKPYCYKRMFYGCTSLETAPTLPATSFATDCYKEMFYNCSSLSSISVGFSAWDNTLRTENWVYGVAPTGQFTAPSGLDRTQVGPNYIPRGWNTNVVATKKDYFYIKVTQGQQINFRLDYYDNGVWKQMRTGCPILYSIDECVTWKELSSFYNYFNNYNNDQEGKATNGKVYLKAANNNGTLSTETAYYNFHIDGGTIDEVGGNIVSLIDPTCTRVEIPDFAFQRLFDGCTALPNAPKLPFTTLGESCYTYMFQGCTGLKSATELPATNLAKNCYKGMFKDCSNSSFTEAPELPATTLKEGCYDHMFDGCSNLSKMKVAFTSWPDDNANTEYWVQGVKSSGTFIAPNDLSAIASTSENNYSKVPAGWTKMNDYLCFTASQNNSSVKLEIVGSPYHAGEAIFQYKKNNGSWKNYTPGNSTAISLKNGEFVLFKAKNTNDNLGKDANNYYHFTISGTVAASGNVMSLLDATCTQQYVQDFAFYKLFASNSALTDVSQLELPALGVGERSYCGMFTGCTSFTTAPSELPATDLGNDCYNTMFDGCTSLTTIPSTLPATTLGVGCYNAMFANCTSLNMVPELPALRLSNWCYAYMFQNCTSLTNAPSCLPCTNLGNCCYAGMFQNTAITIAPELPATELPSGCYGWGDGASIFQGCSNLQYIKVGFYSWQDDAMTNWVKGVPESGTFVCPYELVQNAAEYGVSRIPKDNDHKWAIIYDYLCFTADEYTTGYIRMNKIGNPDAADIYYSVDQGKNWTKYNFTSAPEITVEAGNKIYFRNNKENGTLSKSLSDYYKFSMVGSFTVSGKIASLLNCNCQDITMQDYAFAHLFDGCVSLTNTPTLSATTLSKGCYAYMFKDCSRITSAPVLAAENLKEECYSHMFEGCSKLASAPELLSTSLQKNCYNSMFKDCEWLYTAPTLPATTLVAGCYNNMFSGCSRLNNINVAFTNWVDGATTNWVDGVADEGDFECGGMSKITYGSSYIPKDTDHKWSLVFSPLSFTAEEANSTITLNKVGSPSASLEYSTNRLRWSSYTFGTALTLEDVGDKVYFRAKSTGNKTFSTGTSKYFQFEMTGKIAGKGNIMFLLDHEGDRDTVPANAFYKLFSGCTSLTTSPVLPATTINKKCYQNMFEGCTNLKEASVLPATALAQQCYEYMFIGCTSLKTAPELPASALAANSYRYMFSGCSSLSYIKVGLTATWSQTDWVKDVADVGRMVIPIELYNTLDLSKTSLYASNKFPKDVDHPWTIISDKLNVAFSCNPGDKGTIPDDPSGIYSENDEVAATAQPTSGNRFIGWTVNDVTSGNGDQTMNLVVTDHLNVVANFACDGRNPMIWKADPLDWIYGVQTADKTLGVYTFKANSTDTRGDFNKLDALDYFDYDNYSYENRYRLADLSGERSISIEDDGWKISRNDGGDVNGDGTPTFVVNTWSSEGNDDGSQMTTKFRQYWRSSGTDLPAAVISYNLTGLEAYGTYTVSARVRAYNEGSSNSPMGVTLYAGNTTNKSQDISTGIYNYYTNQWSIQSAMFWAVLEVVGQADKDGKLTIGLNVDPTNCNWISFKDVTVSGSYNGYIVAAPGEPGTLTILARNPEGSSEGGHNIYIFENGNSLEKDFSKADYSAEILNTNGHYQIVEQQITSNQFVIEANAAIDVCGLFFTPNYIVKLPEDDGAMESGWTLTVNDNVTAAPVASEIQQPTYWFYDRNVLYFSRYKDGGVVKDYTTTFTTPHYVNAKKIKVEGTSVESSIVGKLSISGTDKDAANAVELPTRGSQAVTTWFTATDQDSYGKVFDITLSQGMYGIITVYGELKSHFEMPVMSFDYNTNTLTMSAETGATIYYSTDSEISPYTATSYDKYTTALNLSAWVNEATDYDNITYYAVATGDGKEPSVVSSLTIYRYPKLCGYCLVSANDVTSLTKALSYAKNVASENYRVFIFLPEGEYNLGGTCLTELPGYTSLIGERVGHTVIKSAGTQSDPTKNGTIYLSGECTYLQDLTVQNTGSTGVAVFDKGSNNVYYNVEITAPKTVYYAKGNWKQRCYLENCSLQGKSDIVFGVGDIWFENCTFDLNGGSNVSSQTTKKPTRYGHVFHKCTVENGKNGFTLSTPVSDYPAAVWKECTIDGSCGGYGTNKSNLTLRYYDGNNVDGDGNAIAQWSSSTIPSDYNSVTTVFCAYAEFNLPVWNPATESVQRSMKAVVQSDNNLFFDAEADTKFYLIEARSKTDDTDVDYRIIDSPYFNIYDDVSDRTLSVRAANDRGGFGTAMSATIPTSEAIEVTLNAYGYATFSCDQQVAFVGASAYRGKVYNDVVALTRVNAYDIVPANTGVFLTGSPNSTVCALPFADSGTDYSISSELNDWIPCVGHDRTFVTLRSENSCTSACHFYILKSNMFLKVENETNGGVRANKACLHTQDSNNAPALRILFANYEEDFEEGTGIEKISHEPNEDSEYDLSGRSANQNQKGIVICNGKAILVK